MLNKNIKKKHFNRCRNITKTECSKDENQKDKNQKDSKTNCKLVKNVSPKERKRVRCNRMKCNV